MTGFAVDEKSSSDDGGNFPVLPAFEPLRWGGASESYGAGDVAAAYCGFPQFRPVHGIWQHGWHPLGVCFGIQHLMQTALPIAASDNCWVARQDQEAYLRSIGHRNARAIGLPVVYLPKATVPRIPNSLLVMPVHSTVETKLTIPFENYAQELRKILHQFSRIVVCVHAACFEKGYWLDAVQSLGVGIVQGARGTDRNALRRMQNLFASFEFVTTNGFGSLLAYASYFGAKPSIYGTYAEPKPEEFGGCPIYNGQAELIDKVAQALSSQRIRQQFPDLFCHPRDARLMTDWGAHQVGSDCRVSPAELRGLFGWGPLARAAWTIRRLIPEPCKVVYRAIRSRCKARFAG